MTRRAACLCVLALLASASLFVAPALASEEDAASSEVAFAAAPSASVRSAAAISDAVAPEAAPEAAASASSDVAAVASAEAFAPAPATAEQFGERKFESLSLGVSAEERREESAARTNEKLTPLPYDFFSSSKTQTRRDHRPVRHGPGDLRRPRRRHPR